ncbi:MAG: response regulator [Bacteroidales bacterium]|nr:response regulator [Bacteroidales bacterium]
MMKFGKAVIVLLFTLLIIPDSEGQNIFRFVHMGSEEGLSQNTAFSILFDSKGFMWVGTMNGLNRYDGYEFKIYRSSGGNPESFTNNRVVRLWEDKRGFIWLETYDGYYHFFNPETEIFTSLPRYEGNVVKNITMHSFLQYSDDIILVGSTIEGLFILTYNPEENSYSINQYTEEKEGSVNSDNIKFLHSDRNGNIWIGTSRGLNRILSKDLQGKDIKIQEFSNKGCFNSVCETENQLWFGTEKNGISIYEKASGSIRELNTSNTSGLVSDNITRLYFSRSSGRILVCFDNKGIELTDTTGTEWLPVQFHGRNVGLIYEDRSGQIWLASTDFGITRLNPENVQTRYYVLTPEEIKPLTDLERPQFYEDRNDNLWIGLHGAGLALYNRGSDIFEFFRNEPGNPNTISSNFIHCITEDKSGQLWLGTGQVLGGIEKVIVRNNALEHYLPVEKPADILDNVARAVLEDKNGNLWVATKAGRLHIYDSTLKQADTFTFLPGLKEESVRNTTYSLFCDSKGYIWIGSKGHGLSVSKKPLPADIRDYRKMHFRRFEYKEDNEASLGNNNIYSICEDTQNNIWVGTYGNGITIISNPHGDNPMFTRINQENSNLSSNLIRHLLIDRKGNLWVATTFGLNLLTKKNIENKEYNFRLFIRNPFNEKSLSYNDIIHIYEDTFGRLWFGTFGGGVDMLEPDNLENPVFKHYTFEIDPGLAIIFGIVEDKKGHIWLSSENGLISLDPSDGTAEILNTLSGLGFNSFSENTCFVRRDGSLVFGGNMGFEVIRPDKLNPGKPDLRVELTKLMLFNKEVPINQKGSPLQKNISFLEELSLKYSQSSFSIDFSALDFLDPENIQYSYRLDNFENSWNNVGNQHRAAYTNLPPGNYVFRVKSIRPGVNASSPERILKIKIHPPWWKTRLAYFIYLLLITSIAAIIYKAVTRINRYKNELAIEKKVNDLKLQFFTNISHEIRTPLTLIIGPLEDLLADKNISPERRLQMEIMLKNAKRMNHLITQLLDFRKVQNNRMVLKVKELDIVKFTREIYDTFLPLAKHKGIYFNFRSDFESFSLFGDPNKLDTIIYNIISNAIKFTPTGKTVTVSIEEPEKKEFLDIAVTDEGPGIPQKNLADIFTRYTILSNKELAGTGIGLSLSWELARLHRGDILISSAVGKGSTFRIRLLKGKDHFIENLDQESDSLPIVEPAENLLSLTEEQKEYEEHLKFTDQTDKHIMLIVEDNHEILNYIIQSLKSRFVCIGARDGKEGLHLAKTMNPDIIITDIRMPEMDGLAMTRMLKEDFNTSHIPVIMLTSKSDLKDQIEGIECGAEAYITKPFSMEYLKTVAGNLLNQRNKVIARYVYNRTNGSEELKVCSKDQEFLEKAVSYIKENYSADFSIDSLAEVCNVSRTVLYNKIKGLTGSSPLEFVRKMKLNIAVQLLDSGYNVSEAAYKTGFSDVKYFSRLFKAQFGYSPSRRKSDSVTPSS